MMAFRFGMLLAIPAALVVMLLTESGSAGDCTYNQRRAWTDLSRAEKKAYIDAELCLVTSPPRTGLIGAQTRFEELQWAHIVQMRHIHGVAAFLYWHRYTVTVHERLLQDECGYRGAQPYWDEMQDVRSMEQSEVFDPTTGFGGNGEDGDGCLTDGPFADMTLHLGNDFTATKPYCLTRSFSQRDFQSADARYVDRCYALDKFRDAWPCYEGRPHAAGHNGIGGVMARVNISPGDPLFYLHHAYLDKLFNDWQQGGESRMTAVSGPNIQPDSPHSRPVGLNLTIDNNDNGPETTAGHNLWMAGIMENVTISDVMDITDDVICAEYV